ncbi:uncharacterized protein LOC127851841 [Dreissena polymorpha]|nr:uncharacterized protein LOC127851841 [Dreissena polymorpha]
MLASLDYCTFKQPTNMIQHVLLVLGVAASTALGCQFDIQKSQFYWKNEVNICTDDLCKTYDYLPCEVSKDYILDQAIAHTPEDVLYEIEVMKNYFNTFIPTPNNSLPFTCDGVCSKNMRSIQLQRIFTKVNVKDPNNGAFYQENRMCIVIGPDIYYQQCGGHCDVPDYTDRYCLPDLSVKVKLWVYCPDVTPSCHKVDFDIPLSCTCKKITCQKGMPLGPVDLPQRLMPPAPPNWIPGKGVDVMNPGKPIEVMNPGIPIDFMNPGIPMGLGVWKK